MDLHQTLAGHYQKAWNLISTCTISTTTQESAETKGSWHSGYLHGVVVKLVDGATGTRQRGVECGVIAAKVLTMLHQNPELLEQPTRLRDEALSEETLKESNTHLVVKGDLSAPYRNSLDTCFLPESQVKVLAFMHMGTDPTQERPLNGRWPFKCTSFDEMLVDLASIMVNAARQPDSSFTFCCYNTESQGSRRFH